MICYAHECNSILGHPMKNISLPELLKAYKTFYATLQRARFAPKLHRLDNKMSTEVE